MVAFPTYELGTVSVAANSTTVTATGSPLTIWSGVNAQPGDTIYIDGAKNQISDVTDEPHIELMQPSSGAVTNAT